jgi:hypothetical protein
MISDEFSNSSFQKSALFDCAAEKQLTSKKRKKSK